MLRSGIGGQLHVKAIRIGNLQVPAKLIPSIIARIRRGAPPAGLAADAIEVPLPATVGDVRIRGGKITLYRNTP